MDSGAGLAGAGGRDGRPRTRDGVTRAHARARNGGAWVMRHGDPFHSADLSGDRRVALAEPPPVAAIAFPLECRGRTIGALVGVDRAASRAEPQLAPATLSALRAALEPGAFALENALHVQRAEALSVTDDLTQ